MTQAPPAAAGTARLAPTICLALAGLVSIVLMYPGRLHPDSLDQLAQARSGAYADWHPPIMAWVWSWLLKLHPNPGVLMVFHQLAYWTGFALIADAWSRSGLRREAWMIVAASLFPLFLHYNREILKDVGMASGIVLALGIVLWFLIQGRRLPGWAIALSLVFLAYGSLSRANAVFAIGPLVCLYVTQGRPTGLVKLLASSVLVSALAIPLSSWINHSLLGAHSQDPLQALQIFDLVGIAARSGDERVWGEHGLTLSEARHCYSSYSWDTMAPWGTCAPLRPKLGFAAQLDEIDPAYVADRNRRWREAILAHPGAYLTHRLAHFNASLYFFVPSFHFRHSKHRHLMREANAGRFSPREIRMDYLKKNVLLWPVTWVGLGLSILLLLGSPVARGAGTAPLSALLVLSGLLYSSAYVLIGVATEFRYHYWTIMAIMIAGLLSHRALGRAISERGWRVMLAGLLMLAIVITGFGARITDVPLL